MLYTEKEHKPYLLIPQLAGFNNKEAEDT